jgi:exodeoxyribonuclease VII small subunit
VAAVKFEKALSRLEEIVRALEKGDLPLEDSIKLFEEGIRWSKTCMKMLEDAEKKVEVLIATDGKTTTRPFDPEEEENRESRD